MTIPTSHPLPPDDSERLSAARRRRRRRMIFPGASDQQAIFLEELAHKVTPSVEFFLFAILSSLILGLAILFNIPALYFLAALVSPFMGPVLGLGLSAITGAHRFFIQSLGGLSVAAIIYFLGGMLAGWFSNFLWSEISVNPTQIYYHTAFSWPDMAVLAVGAIVSAILLVQDNKQRPLVSSIALAYEIFLPIGVAGFGLASHLPGIFPNAAYVFGANLLAAVLLCLLTLAFQRLRPRESWGFTLGAAAVMLLLMVLAFIGNTGALPVKAVGAMPTITLAKPQITLTSTVAVAPASATPSSSPSQVVPQITPTGPTFTPTNTLIPTRTPTITPSPAPTPVYAKIVAKEDAGALVRKEPDFTSPVLKSLLNGSLVEILPNSVEKNGIIWYKVRLPDGGGDGWIVRYVLVTATAVR